MTFSETHN